MEHPSLKLIAPPPEDRLAGWLEELYGKQVEVSRREVLRHRDLSYVARLVLRDAIPETIIYKVVLPPWDIEQDLHERVLIPSVSNSARLYLSAHWHELTALFLEDLGKASLLETDSTEAPMQVGTELAKLHRAFTYRIDEVYEAGIVRKLLPRDYLPLAERLTQSLCGWGLLEEKNLPVSLCARLASALSPEPVSLVHGDLYAENILLSGSNLHIIDWSWFTIIGVPLMDLATVTSPHVKNGTFVQHRETVIEAYCQEYSRNRTEVEERLPFAETLARLFFLDWLVERRNRGIMGTTVGSVDDLIKTVLAELSGRLARLPG